MQVNIQIIETPELATSASFELSNFQTEKDFKEALAIIFMISADYYLDPELELQDLKEFVGQASESNKAKVTLTASEDGLELEFEE